MLCKLRIDIIKREILKKDVISFDVFDTLISRNCLHPNDIFEYVEKKYNIKSKCKIKDFKTKRINAYHQAKKEYNSEEVTFEQLYEFIDKKYDVDLLKKIEIETEFKFCVANSIGKELYLFAKENKKRIICVSDMYLDSKTIKKILKNCDYDIDEIYVSSEYNKKKNNRELFKELIKQKIFKKDEILHIGDAEKGDYLYPKLLGIKTALFPTVKKTYYLSPKKLDLLEENDNLIYSLAINNSNKDVFYNFGYELLGPVCLYFCLWINNQINDKKQKTLFCARDMEMIYNMYQQLFPNNNSEYFYVSRRSLRLPYLYKYNDYKSIELSITDSKHSLRDLLNNLNLLDEDTEIIINKYNINLDKKRSHEELANGKELKILYSKILKNKIENIGKDQFDYFNKYINSFNTNNINLVDVGWRCTTQLLMDEIFENKEIKGYYFGINSEKNLYENISENNAKGYIFNKNNNFFEEANIKVYSSMVLFEKLFSSQRPSTIKYKNEFPYYVFSTKNDEKDISIDLVQKGAYRFINDISKYIDVINRDNSYTYIKLLLDCFTNPTLKISKNFGEITNDNIYERKLASPKGLLFYIFHPRELKKDVYESGWKIGFMRRLFKIKIPYYNIWKIAYFSKKKGD